MHQNPFVEASSDFTPGYVEPLSDTPSRDHVDQPQPMVRPSRQLQIQAEHHNSQPKRGSPLSESSSKRVKRNDGSATPRAHNEGARLECKSCFNASHLTTYQCQQCLDYYLCSRCIINAASAHPGHTFKRFVPNSSAVNTAQGQGTPALSNSSAPRKMKKREQSKTSIQRPATGGTSTPWPSRSHSVPEPGSSPAASLSTTKLVPKSGRQKTGIRSHTTPVDDPTISQERAKGSVPAKAPSAAPPATAITPKSEPQSPRLPAPEVKCRNCTSDIKGVEYRCKTCVNRSYCSDALCRGAHFQHELEPVALSTPLDLTRDESADPANIDVGLESDSQDDLESDPDGESSVGADMETVESDSDKRVGEPYGITLREAVEDTVADDALVVRNSAVELSAIRKQLCASADTMTRLNLASDDSEATEVAQCARALMRAADQFSSWLLKSFGDEATDTTPSPDVAQIGHGSDSDEGA